MRTPMRIEDGLTALEEFEGDTDPNQSDLLAQTSHV